MPRERRGQGVIVQDDPSVRFDLDESNEPAVALIDPTIAYPPCPGSRDFEQQRCIQTLSTFVHVVEQGSPRVGTCLVLMGSPRDAVSGEPPRSWALTGAFRAP